MSYRLIDSNELAIKYPEVNDMPCIYADLPKGIDGEHYVLKQEPILDKIMSEIEEQVLESLSDCGDDWFAAEKVNECLEIINKYKTKSEVKNANSN